MSCVVVCAGVVAGIFGSLVGMGGAFVMIPALTAFLRASQHQAHGKTQTQAHASIDAQTHLYMV